MSLLRPKRGMFRDFYGINALISPVDESKYRELLPAEFEPPESPQASAFVVHYRSVHPWPMTSYREGAITLKCVFQGKEYWYVYTMPVTKRVPMWGGLSVGFPKYLADRVSLVKKDESWEGEITHKGQTKLALRFDPGLQAEPGPAEKFATTRPEFFWGDGITLLPPAKGPKVIAIELHHPVQPSWQPTYGMVKIDCDKAENHYGLFDPDEEYFGSYNEFNGGMNLHDTRLR